MGTGSYGVLYKPFSNSCGELWPLTEAFFCPPAKQRASYDIFPILAGNLKIYPKNPKKNKNLKIPENFRKFKKIILLKYKKNSIEEKRKNLKNNKS